MGEGMLVLKEREEALKTTSLLIKKEVMICN